MDAWVEEDRSLVLFLCIEDVSKKRLVTKALTGPLAGLMEMVSGQLASSAFAAFNATN